MSCFLWNYQLTENWAFPVEYSVPDSMAYSVEYPEPLFVPPNAGSGNSTEYATEPGRILGISWGILKKLFAVVTANNPMS